MRRWWGLLSGRPFTPPPAENDPAHYALIISGMMICAFGILIFVFTTAFALFSR